LRLSKATLKNLNLMMHLLLTLTERHPNDEKDNDGTKAATT
jgi:hypothetical protein